MTMSTSSRPSRPVDIPARRHNSQSVLPTDAKGGIAPPLHQTRGSRRQQPRNANSLHDVSKVRPAVAALLAMTSITPPRAQRGQRDKQRWQQQQQQRVDGKQNQRARSGSSITIDELVDEWKSEEDLLAASADSKASTSALLMSVLLEPPTAHLVDSPYSSEHESAAADDVRGKRESKTCGDASRRRTGARSARTSSTTSRETNISYLSSSPTSLGLSMSNDSMPSLLGGYVEEDGTDEEALSLASLSIGDPATPASFRCRSGSLGAERMRSEKKQLLSPPTVDCAVDHPLLAHSRTSHAAHASGLDKMDMRCGTDRKGKDANTDTSPRTSSANLSPSSNTSIKLNRSRTVTIDSENGPVLSQAQPLNSSSLTILKTSFKSNLTASFNVLASAARSFSNFTAPSLPPDDLLTQSLLAPNPSPAQHLPSQYPSARFPSEMRPKPVDGIPEPALRRYLNPGVRVGTISSTSALPRGTDAEKHLRQTGTARLDAGARTLTATTTDTPQESRLSRQGSVRQVRRRDDKQHYLGWKGENPNSINNPRDASSRSNSTDSNSIPCELSENNNYDDYEDEMIPLEPYKRPISRPNTANLPLSSSPFPSTPSFPSPLLPTKAKHHENNASAGVHIRPREPRENSDFLRIVVLEMNMRRRGKLDGDAVGKARVWLPPRRVRGVEVFCNVSGNGYVGDGIESEARGRCVTGPDASMVIPRRWMGEVPSY